MCLDSLLPLNGLKLKEGKGVRKGGGSGLPYAQSRQS